jgi:hypothetical protein
MSPAEFQEMMSDTAFPVTLKTTGGRTYTVRSPNSFWVSEDYPTTVIVTAPGKGLTLLAMSAIEAVQVEHEAVPR